MSDTSTPHANGSVLPVIDFAAFSRGTATDRETIAAQIHAAVLETGFFYLDGHATSKALGEAMQVANWFFDLPEKVKKTIAIEKSSCHRGWYALGGECLDAATHPEGDLKEGLKIGHDLDPAHPLVKAGIPLHGPNLWMPEDPALGEQCPARKFNTALRTAYHELSSVAAELMQAFALGLGLPETYFDRYLNTPMATLSPIRYPPLARADARISAGAHTDFGCLSLLAQDDTGGLEIQHPETGWITVPPRPNSLVVNIGDMLSLWTGGLYRSTLHRVRNTSGISRSSMVFFFDPQHDTPLQAIGSNQHTPSPETTLTAVQHLLNKISSSFDYVSFHD